MIEADLLEDSPRTLFPSGLLFMPAVEIYLFLRRFLFQEMLLLQQLFTPTNKIPKFNKPNPKRN